MTNFRSRASRIGPWVAAAAMLVPGAGPAAAVAGRDEKPAKAPRPPGPPGTSRRSIKQKGRTMAKSCDFGRSFVTFVLPGGKNNARIQVEARCVISDRQTGKDEVFYLVASCKGEDTFGKGPLFLEPSYDFCMIYSPTEFRIIRVHYNHRRDNNTVDKIEGRFESIRYQIKLVDADVLADNRAIVDTTLTGRVLNGRVTVADPTGRYEATIEFPIKTMNVNANQTIYQVDTGPILVPNWDAEKARWVERFDLAFVAYNRADDVHFVIQTPTPVVDDDPKGPKVSAYSRTTRQDATCQVVALR